VIPGGETLAQARRRSFNAVKSIIASNPGEDIAIVSHRVIVKLFVMAMLGISNEKFWNIKQDLACIDVFRFDEKGFTALHINDIGHLIKVNKGTQLSDF